MNQKRVKSPILWGAVGAIFLLILKALGYDEAASLASSRAEELFNVICGALAILGVVNNPTNKGGF